MCMHCRSLWSRINNLMVIDQYIYIYLGCPIASKGIQLSLKKKNCQTDQEPARSSLSLRCLALPTPSPPNTATGKIRSIERDWCCRPLMSHGRSATVERSGPSRETDAVDHWCRMGDLRQWKQAPLPSTAPRGHWHGWPSDSPLPSRATLPTSWAWATGLPGTRPPGLSNWAATVLLAAAGLTIDASCAVGHASIAAYVSQISYPYGPCIPGDVGAFTLLMNLCISLIVLRSQNIAVGEEGIPISKFYCRWSASCRPWRWPGMHWEASDVKRWKGVLYYVWSSFAFWKVV